METRGSLLGPVPLSPGPTLNCAHGARTPGDLAFSLAALSHGLWLPRTLEERGAGPPRPVPVLPTVACRGPSWPPSLRVLSYLAGGVSPSMTGTGGPLSPPSLPGTSVTCSWCLLGGCFHPFSEQGPWWGLLSRTG